LDYYDLFAPISAKSKKIKFQEGLDMYMESMYLFDDEFFQISKDMFVK